MLTAGVTEQPSSREKRTEVLGFECTPNTWWSCTLEESEAQGSQPIPELLIQVRLWCAVVICISNRFPGMLLPV